MEPVQEELDQSYTSHVPDPASARFFLQHHGALKGNKLRVAYDAATAFKGKCLDDAIISSPALQPSLGADITRFREGEIAWASDIEAMFIRFRLSSGKQLRKPSPSRMSSSHLNLQCWI